MFYFYMEYPPKILQKKHSGVFVYLFVLFKQTKKKQHLPTGTGWVALQDRVTGTIIFFLLFSTFFYSVFLLALTAR